MKTFLQFSINDFTLDEYQKYPTIVEELSKRFQSQKEVNEAIRFLKKKKKELNIENIDFLLEELQEIKNDLKWSKSKKGQLVLYVNSKYGEWETEVLKRFKIDDLMLRAHSEKLAICAVGTFNEESQREELVTAIEKITDLKVIDYLKVKS